MEREPQRPRFAAAAKGSGRLPANANVRPKEIREFCQVGEAGHNLLRAAVRQLHMSVEAMLSYPDIGS